MNTTLENGFDANEIALGEQCLRELGDLELVLVGGGDVAVAGR
jgi:hypothetical protein